MIITIIQITKKIYQIQIRKTKFHKKSNKKKISDDKEIFPQNTLEKNIYI